MCWHGKSYIAWLLTVSSITLLQANVFSPRLFFYFFFSSKDMLSINFRERESDSDSTGRGKKHQQVALKRDRIHNLGKCQTGNQSCHSSVYGASLQPNEPHWPGPDCSSFHAYHLTSFLTWGPSYYLFLVMQCLLGWRNSFLKSGIILTEIHIPLTSYFYTSQQLRF